MNLVVQGIQSKKCALTEIHGISERDAITLLEEINAEAKRSFESMAGAVSDSDLFGGFDGFVN